jgi:hypothetical protein
MTQGLQRARSDTSPRIVRCKALKPVRMPDGARHEPDDEFEATDDWAQSRARMGAVRIIRGMLPDMVQPEPEPELPTPAQIVLDREGPPTKVRSHVRCRLANVCVEIGEEVTLTEKIALDQSSIGKCSLVDPPTPRGQIYQTALAELAGDKGVPAHCWPIY